MDLLGNSLMGFIVMFGGSLWSPVGGAESPKGDSLYAYPAGGYFSVMKSRQKNFI